MGLSVSPAAIWQQFIDIQNKQRFMIIMDNAMVFSNKEEHFEDLENYFKALIK